MWSMVENNLGIIIASLPPLSPLVKGLKNASSNRSYGVDGSVKKGSSYALGSLSNKSGLNGRRGSIPLRSHPEGIEGDSDKFESRTTVRAGARVAHGNNFSGDNSSEEYIINGREGIMAVTEVVVSSDTMSTAGKGRKDSRNDPFEDPRNGNARYP